MAVMLHRVLPDEPAREHVAYRKLVAGVFSLFVTQPQLRRRAYFGALIFACNSALWTTLSFLLAGSAVSLLQRRHRPLRPLRRGRGTRGERRGPSGRSPANARQHDRRVALAPRLVWSLGLGRDTVVLLALGIMVLDTGMQGMQITNQSVIYSILPEGRSRMNSAYMVSALSRARRSDRFWPDSSTRTTAGTETAGSEQY